MLVIGFPHLGKGWTGVGGMAGNTGGRVVVRDCFLHIYIGQSAQNVCLTRSFYPLLSADWNDTQFCKETRAKLRSNTMVFTRRKGALCRTDIYRWKMCRAACHYGEKCSSSTIFVFACSEKQAQFCFACRETDPRHFCLPAKKKPHQFFRFRRKKCVSASKPPWCGKSHQALHLVVRYAQLLKNMFTRGQHFTTYFRPWWGGFRSRKDW